MAKSVDEKILVTGGTGFIGSHICAVLTAEGRKVILLDNLCNSSSKVIDRLERITGHRPEFVQGDVRDRPLLDRTFSQNNISGVIHLAGLKAVGESVARPLAYFDNNVGGTLELLGSMKQANVKTLIFSSSATVYGDNASVPIGEDSPRSVTNPYGRSKLMVEDILIDLHRAEPAWRIACLRYFNPVGAHASGLIGEDPTGIPNNLLPYISQVAIRRRAQLNVFGGDYSTPDGSGVRDYIHVMDLAEGHAAALAYCNQNGDFLAANLGTGRGISVLEMIREFEKASGRPIPYEIVARREGDIAQCWADASRAFRLLGWKATRGVTEMCEDTWRWQLNNPEGYATN
jgi:UDP-glucose 4-epimerase